MPRATKRTTSHGLGFAVLADRTAQERLDAVGCTSAGTVTAAALERARAASRELLPTEREDLHYSTASTDHAYRRSVSAALGSALAPDIEPLLAGLRYVFGVLVAQRPGPGMGMHHDLPFVDPGTGRAAVVWVPLDDVDARTGTLAFVPGSHHLVDGPQGTPSFPLPLRDIDPDLLSAHLRPVEAPAGTVIVTDPRLAHASTANRTERQRTSAVLVFAPPGAPLVHHWLRPDGDVERFAVDDDFYQRFDLQARPTGVRSIGTVAADFAPVDHDRFLAEVKAAEAYR